MSVEDRAPVSAGTAARADPLDSTVFGAGGSAFGAVGELASLIRSRDWSSTPLGPVGSWPQSLRTTVGIMLNSRFPMFLFWGAGATSLYNDAYRPSLGDKHPTALGEPGEQCWSDIWHIIGPQIAAVMSRGEQTWHSDQLVPFHRNGYLEEIYFTYSYSPVRDESGSVAGTLVVCTETTDQVIAGRRLRTLHRTAGAGGGTPSTVLASVRDVLADNGADLPFALLYRLPGGGTATGPGPVTGAELVWSTSGPAAGGASGAAGTGGDAWREPLAEIAVSGVPVVVGDVRDRCGDVVAGAWPEPVREAVVLPLALSGRASPDYALVCGVSPRKALDGSYREFLELLAAHVAGVVGDAEAREEERLRAAALAELDHAKTAFFSNVSHEFRTPLTLTLGPLEELLTSSRPRPAVEQQQLEEAYRNALRLLRLVNDLLQFSRIQAGDARAETRPVDLARLTTELASAFRSAVEKARIDYVVDCPPLPAPVAVDPGQWEKIVFNLLSNAVKFTFTGSITVRLRAVGDHVELSVSDTGVGIPEHELPRLFERFHRTDDRRGRTYEGSGIGLALVHELARLHGGDVRATSTPGMGSTFVVRVPTAAARPGLPVTAEAPDGLGTTALGLVAEVERWVDDDLPATPSLTAAALRLLPGAASASGPARGAAAASGPARNPGGGRRSGRGEPLDRPGHVLVADDNADMRSYLARLVGARWRVTVVPDGLSALTEARRQRPDLILADVMMPGLDGIELVRAVRADPDLAGTPVVLVSARAGTEASVEALDAGADDYLVKPFAAAELIGRIRANLATARDRRRHLRVVQRHADRLVTLARMTTRFVSARSVQDVATVLVSELPACLPASMACLELPSTVGLVAGDGVPPALADAFRVLGRVAQAERRPVLASPDLVEGTAGRAVLEAVRAAGCSAAAVVPLPDASASGNGSAGWLAVAWLREDGGAPPDVGTEITSTLEAIAQVAAQAVERARRDDRDREVARTLQHGVLPVAPPSLPGLEVQWRYVSATDRSLIGGDWYDAVDLGGGRVGIAVGDVAGHGIDAVAAMTTFRNALRAHLAETASPAEALDRLNRLALSDAGYPHATVVCAVLDLGTLDLSWSMAGHPPPLLLRAGEVTLLDQPLGVPVGVVPDAGYPVASWRLEPGDILFLYTDGLVEHRQEGLRIEALAAQAAAAAGADGWAGGPGGLGGLLDALGSTFLTGEREDDVAMAAVRLRSVPGA